MNMRWIFAAFLIATGIYLMWGRSSRHLAIRRLMFLAFILIGISGLMFEEFTSRISQFFGVNSGTELLTYLITFAFIASTISNYRWRREQEQRMVAVVRQIALNESDEN